MLFTTSSVPRLIWIWCYLDSKVLLTMNSLTADSFALVKMQNNTRVQGVSLLNKNESNAFIHRQYCRICRSDKPHVKVENCFDWRYHWIDRTIVYYCKSLVYLNNPYSLETLKENIRKDYEKLSAQLRASRNENIE